MGNTIIADTAFDQLFRDARTANHWLDQPVDNATLQQIHDIMRFGPTSANCCPLRIVFVQSKDAKEKLKACLDEGNVDKTMKAPVTAIFAQDMKFYEHMKFLFPHTDARAWFEGNQPLIERTASRNAVLQAAYFMIVARGFGLSCGPMSGFNNDKLDEAFLAGTSFKSNFICNLGYGDHSKDFPRSPRFAFDDVCKIV